jgi:hypothetical protein
MGFSFFAGGKKHSLIYKQQEGYFINLVEYILCCQKIKRGSFFDGTDNGKT